MQPWTSYTGDQYLHSGFASLGDAIQRAQAQRIQEEQFAQRVALEQRAQDLGYYAGDQNRAAEYYRINTQYDPRRAMPVPTGRGQERVSLMTGQLFPDPAETRTSGGLGIVFDANGNQLGEAAIPILDPQGNVVGNKAIVNGKETVIRPQGENIGTAIGKALSGQPAAGARPAPAGTPPLPSGGGTVQPPNPLLPAGNAAGTRPLRFSSSAEVLQALSAGTIDRAAAKRILETQFADQFSR